MSYLLTVYLSGIVVFLWREWIIEPPAVKGSLFVALTWPLAFMYLTVRRETK